MKMHNRYRALWRMQFKQFLKEYQLFVIGGLWLLTFLLGYVGFRKHLPAAGESHTFWDILYRILQLFVLDSGSMDAIEPPLRWELNFARFLAPTVVTYTAITAVLAIFHEKLQIFRLRYIKDHVVVCGLGRKGLLLARRFHEKGNRVVIIEKDTDLREQGMIVLIGNATDRELLQKARVQKARCLISVCGDDGINAEVAVHTRELMRDNKGKALTCLIHIVDPQLCSLLREQEIEAQKVDTFRLEFFNVFESGARALLNEFPVYKAQNQIPHMLIVGLGRMGEALLLQAARNWKVIHIATGEKLRITFIDKEAEIKKQSLCFRYPQLNKICLLLPRQMDINSPEFKQARFLFDNQSHCDVTNIYVCLSDDSFSLSTALVLHKHLKNHGVPIVVRMNHNAGLATLLRGEDFADSSFRNLYAFGLLDNLCRPDLLLGGINELLAKAIHEEYVHLKKKKGITPQTDPSMVPWEELPEKLKESSRWQAGDIGRKLNKVNCGIAPLADWDAELFKFTQDEVERLAEMEHERWNEERLRDGWKYGAEKDVEKKITPYLVPWSQLPDEIKEYDRNTVREIPAFLARAGFQIERHKS